MESPPGIWIMALPSNDVGAVLNGIRPNAVTETDYGDGYRVVLAVFHDEATYEHARKVLDAYLSRRVRA